jgi:hypothetical protein
MIQSAGNSVVGKSLGFENLARFAPKPTKQHEVAKPQDVAKSQDVAKPADEGARPAKSASVVVELTPEQQQQINKLKQIDAKVRAHEQAHISVGADLVRGGPTFGYETGPDNKRYAVSGEVSIDTSPARTPEETIPKAQHIRATALAPAEPSAQDHSVAAQAGQLELQARQALAVQQQEAAAATDGGSAKFYRGVERTDGQTAKVGGRFDLFV